MQKLFFLYSPSFESHLIATELVCISRILQFTQATFESLIREYFALEGALEMVTFALLRAVC